VLLLNDDYTPMDFVIQLLVEVFNRSLDEATTITMKVHDEGQGIAGTYSHEVAEQKQTESSMISRHNGHPLKIVLEKLE
jgi:ATP-dependent Clp protease adaptor protein ClpS